MFITMYFQTCYFHMTLPNSNCLFGRTWHGPLEERMGDGIRGHRPIGLSGPAVFSGCRPIGLFAFMRRGYLAHTAS